MKPAKQYEFDVAISYAGEDREYAEALAESLRYHKLEVFYDNFEKPTLWGKNLYTSLSDVYENKAHYCIMFLSQHYAEKLWTNHERQAAQARAFKEKEEEYILPIRLDDAEIPGILSTISYLRIPPETIDTLTDIILTKLGREPYVPSSPSASTQIIVPPTFGSGIHASIQDKGSKTKEQAEDALLQDYLEKIETIYQADNATELTYRPALQELLEKLDPGISVTHEPMREEYGSPDYVISRSTGHGPLKIGYVETKDVDVNLDKIEQDAQRTESKTRDGQQLKKYLQSLDNFLFTNYRDFHWFLHGERRMTTRLISPVIDKGIALQTKGRKKASSTSVEQLLIGTHAQSSEFVVRVLTGFLSYSTEPIKSPRVLAIRMARIAHIIRDMIIVSLNYGDESETLQDLYTAFKQVLLPELDIPEFADMFAQTLAYGLFAARYNHKSNEPFRRQDAAREIPNTNPFLADLFEKITGRELDRVPFVGFVDDLAQLLAQTDMNAVLADFGKRTRQEDPLIHFYETFLNQYNPKLQELRGVYYTPEPVISYIVRSVDYLLKTQFGCSDGLADTSITKYPSRNEEEKESGPRVLLLDPACGTGTFLYSIINHIREEFRRTNNAGAWSSYVHDHLLPRLFGFELLMAPYAMAHLKLAMQLAALDLPEQEQREWSYDFNGKERLGIYLTNSLDEAIIRSELIFGRSISEEANAAAEIKSNLPIMVILGNPPYSGHSANKGDWINDLLHGRDFRTQRTIGGNYFEVDGEPLGERNPKWLNDDYVKFIRFAQWRIERTGYGILAFITNHGYLDNPTFRGMRQSLLQSFDDIYVLDLHGSSKKQERSPDGTKDENVFDIMPGVAISIFVKRRENLSKTATVHHADLWGLREVYEKMVQGQQLVGGKYQWLSHNDITSTEWKLLTPDKPFYLFVPQNSELREEYAQGWKVTEILPINVLGFQTHRDHFAIDFDRESLFRRINEMRDNHLSEQEFAEKYQLSNNRDWKLAKARQMLRADTEWRSQLISCYYRPFDWRSCYFSEVTMDYPRRELLNHVAGKENICLLTSRQQATLGYRHVLVAKDVANDCVISTTSREANQVFPLYLYPDPKKKGLIDANRESTAPYGRYPNMAQTFITEFTQRLNMEYIVDGMGDLRSTFGPEDIFNYMYAVLHSPAYRTRYAEFLKIDFPHLPLTSNTGLFRELCKLGARLVELHLLEKIGQQITMFHVKGDDTVEKVAYTQPADKPERGCVWINRIQYFEGVPPEVWEFQIGGYQVCQSG